MWRAVCFLTQRATSHTAEMTHCFIQYNSVMLCFSDLMIFPSPNMVHFKDHIRDNTMGHIKTFCGTNVSRMDEYLLTLTVLDDHQQAQLQNHAKSS